MSAKDSALAFYIKEMESQVKSSLEDFEAANKLKRDSAMALFDQGHENTDTQIREQERGELIKQLDEQYEEYKRKNIIQNSKDKSDKEIIDYEIRLQSEKLKLQYDKEMRELLQRQTEQEMEKQKFEAEKAMLELELETQEALKKRKEEIKEAEFMKKQLEKLAAREAEIEYLKRKTEEEKKQKETVQEKVDKEKNSRCCVM